MESGHFLSVVEFIFITLKPEGGGRAFALPPERDGLAVDSFTRQEFNNVGRDRSPVNHALVF